MCAVSYLALHRAFNPLQNFVVPRPWRIALILFFSRQFIQFCCIEPPPSPRLVFGVGFRPELVAIATERINVNSAAQHWPETAVASFIHERRSVICGTGEHRTSRDRLGGMSIGRAVVVNSGSEECFDSLNILVTNISQFAELNNPAPV